MSNEEIRASDPLVDGQVYILRSGNGGGLSPVTTDANRQLSMGRQHTLNDPQVSYMLKQVGDEWELISMYLGSSFRVTVLDGSPDNGVPIIVASADGTASQRFRIEQVPVMASFGYKILTAASNFTKCITILDDVTSTDGKVIQGEYDSNDPYYNSGAWTFSMW